MKKALRVRDMFSYGEVLKTQRLIYLCSAIVVASIALALLNVALGALCVAAYFITYSVVSYSHLRLVSKLTTCRLNKVEVELEDVDIVLSLDLSISSKGGFAYLKVYLDLPPQLSLLGVRYTYSKRIALKPGHARFSLTLPRRTGLHVVGPLKVAITDFFDAFEAPIYYLESIVIKIPPKMGLAPVAKWYGIVRSSIGSRTLSPGLGVEYHSTREYRPEDELRHIDWKATARLGKLHVKVFEVETPLRVMIILDAQKYTFIGSPKSLFEHCADLAVALSSYLVKRGDRLKFIAITEDGVKYSSEARSYRGLVEILDVLSNIRWPEYSPAPRVESPQESLYADHISKSLKDVSASVIFSPVLSSRRAYDILKLARQAQESGARVIVVAPLIAFFSTTSKVNDAIYKVLRYNIVLQELKNIELLRNSGIQVVALSPHRALERVVSELERVRIAKTR
ncbi:MAG: DUF58 domain-containing protein [Sulfolobales archaeon]